jgi:hypothetical protein
LQNSPLPQVRQVLPETPHAIESSPERQTPVASQHPLQEIE